MFADETLESVGFESTWAKSEQQRESRSCQTRPLRTRDAAAQAAEPVSRSSQTEEREERRRPAEPERPELLRFLRAAEALLLRELERSRRSRAFDAFQPSLEESPDAVSLLFRLQCPCAQVKALQVSSVSWSCTGAVVACGYGRADDGDWSGEASLVCTWNLERGEVKPQRPDLTIHTTSCVTSLCFHPLRPSVLAGGLYSGDVLVWDTGRTRDPLLAQTGTSADSHRDPVYHVCWVAGAGAGEFLLLGAGSGGGVLLWALDGPEARLVLRCGYALLQKQMPQCGAGLQAGGGAGVVGVTCLSLSRWDPDTFVVGSESGLVLRCSFSAQCVADTPSEGTSVVLRAPVRFRFSPPGGAVHSLHCSPFHRNLFASVGTDGLAHLHTLLQPRPLRSLRVADAYVFGVRWSPTRPLVFATVTGHGELQVFDLGQRSQRPVVSVQQNTGGGASLCLEFSGGRVAVGSADGSVNIWQLSATLTRAGAREAELLDQLVTT